MPEPTRASADVRPADPAGDDRSDLVVDVQRAVILAHGFILVMTAVPVGLLLWRTSSREGASSGPVLFGVIVGTVISVIVGGLELYLSAQTGRRLARWTRLVSAVYALGALTMLVRPILALWWPEAVAASWPQMGGVPELPVALQALLAFSAVMLACAVGRKTLIVAGPAWLVPWCLSHGIRAVVGAAYYLVYDLGAEPLWRRLQAIPRYQRLFLTGGGLRRVVLGVAGGPALAALGGLVGWGLILLGRRFIPPIVHPLLYLIVVDLVLLPLLPMASITMRWLYRRVAARSEAWVFVISPVFVTLAPVAAAVLLWLALHRWLIRGAAAIGRWQIGAARPTVQIVLGAVWTHVAVWILVTALNAQSGLVLLGMEVPGAELFRTHLRTPVLKLPAEMRASFETLLPELFDLAVKHDNTRAFYDYTMLTGEDPDAQQNRFYNLSIPTQRRLTGMPWYYSPAEFQEDRVERCVVFWGCLLLAVMTMFRWPGLHEVLLPHVLLRSVAFVLRVGAPTGLLAACLLGRSARPEMIAMIAGLALVGVAVLALGYWLAWLVSRSVGPTRHYAPFMATRLLQQRRIAFFAIGAVTLCVAMVLIVISVMGGFLDLVRDRSRGLLGDLIMQNGSLTGFAGYQEFIDHIKQLRDEDGRLIVDEATPMIYTYGVLRFPVTKVTNMARVVGLRFDESVRVTRFGESLDSEKLYPGSTSLGRQRQPYWGRNADSVPVLPPDLEAARAKGLAAMTPAERKPYERGPNQDYPGPGDYAYHGASDVSAAFEGLRSIRAGLQLIGEDAAAGAWSGRSGLELEALHNDLTSADSPTSAVKANGETTQPEPTSRPNLSQRMMTLAGQLEDLVDSLPDWPETKVAAKALAGAMDQMMTASDELADHDAKVTERINTLIEALQKPIDTLDSVRTRPGYMGKSLYGMVIGRDMVARRKVNRIYERYYPRGIKMTVAVLPLTMQGAFTKQDPISLPLRYVDDSRFGVYEIDSQNIYVDFEMLQRTMEMGPLQLRDGGGQTSPRTSQVLIKLTEGQDYLARRDLIFEKWKRFCMTWPHPHDAAPMRRVEINTWEEQQAQFIAAVQTEKILVTSLFSVISAVAIFLVVCIFYMIVTEKTRDIGILKSVGASAGGVAGVFLAYGAAIGVVGASLGLWIGTIFVHNINTIQDWIARIHPGLRIWSAEVYSFDIIPDTVKFEEAAVIFVVAIVSSVLGATFPALRAGRIWPVEALRYE